MRKIARTLDEAYELIQQQKPFRLRGTGQPSLWATNEAPTLFGKLPAAQSVGAEAADYWVFSYETLIAWSTEGEPTVPDVGYSPTTGQHQYLVAAALGVDFRPARGRPVVEIPRNDELWGRARRLRRGGMDGAYPASREPEDRLEAARALQDAGWNPVVRAGWSGHSSLPHPEPRALPFDPHDYGHPGSDSMRYRAFEAQDELIEQVHGWTRAHP
jgi:hypothetical protein